MTREPLLSAAGITAAISAVIGLLTVFGLPLSTDQTAAILAVVAVLAPIAVGLWSRRKVTPVAAPQDNAGNVLTPADPAYSPADPAYSPADPAYSPEPGDL